MDVAGTGPVSIAMLGSSIVSVQGKCYEHCLELLSLMFDSPFLEVLSFWSACSPTKTGSIGSPYTGWQFDQATGQPWVLVPGWFCTLPSRKQLAGHLVLLRNILASEGKDEQAAVEERMALIGMDGLADAADECLTFNRGTMVSLRYHPGIP
jgi:hypothetical protein